MPDSKDKVDLKGRFTELRQCKACAHIVEKIGLALLQEPFPKYHAPKETPHGLPKKFHVKDALQFLPENATSSVELTGPPDQLGEFKDQQGHFSGAMSVVSNGTGTPSVPPVIHVHQQSGNTSALKTTDPNCGLLKEEQIKPGKIIDDLQAQLAGQFIACGVFQTQVVDFMQKVEVCLLTTRAVACKISKFLRQFLQTKIFLPAIVFVSCNAQQCEELHGTKSLLSMMCKPTTFSRELHHH